MSGRPDYDAGDLVVCVLVKGSRGPNWPSSGGRIKNGAIYRVAAIVESAVYPGFFGAQLVGVDHRPMRGFLADQFRKIDPADDAFIRQMRAIKPAREGVTA